MSQDTAESFDAKKARLENPSGWIKLTQYETVRLLVDALLESPPGYQFNKSELERRTGVSRESIRNHLPLLVELGVIEEDTSGTWAEYSLNDDGKVTKELLELNSALNSVLSGEAKNVQTAPEISFPDPDAERDTDIPSSPSFAKQIDNARGGRGDDARTDHGGDSLLDNPPADMHNINAD